MVNTINGQLADTLGAQELFGRTDLIAARTGLRAIGAENHGKNIFYREATLRLEEAGAFDLNEQDQWGQRTVVWARFTHKVSGRSFYHFNTHWCVCSEDQLLSSAITSGSRIAATLQASGAPAVYTGDFNVFAGTDRSKAIRYLGGEIVDGRTSPVTMADTYLQAGGTLNAQGGPGSYGGARVDYVLATLSGWRVSDGTVLPQEIGSDHKAVAAVLDFV